MREGSTASARAIARLTLPLLLGTSTLPLVAQPTESGDMPAPEAAQAAMTQGKQTYLPADFARYSPKNALDMLNDVPGFQIRGADDDARGLGQAKANVLVNGQRLASKSDSLTDQLARIPATSVLRIEIVDGASLAIPGLSGQVGDIITRPDAFSGQFKWRGEARPHFSHPGYTDGEISAKGTLGKVEYTLALSDEANRGAFGGGYRILNGDGSVQQQREGRLWSDSDSPKVSAGLTVHGPGSSLGNFNGFYRRIYSTYEEDEMREPATGSAGNWVLHGSQRGSEYELSGDYSFGLFGGSLKLIGLDRFKPSRLWRPGGAGLRRRQPIARWPLYTGNRHRRSYRPGRIQLEVGRGGLADCRRGSL